MALHDRHAARHENGTTSAVGSTFEHTRRRVRDAVEAVWADGVSRGCAIVAVVSLWFGVTLVERLFVAPFAAAACVLWLRRHHRAAAADALEDDDWF